MRMSQILRNMPRKEADTLRRIIIEYDEKMSVIRKAFRAGNRTGTHLRFSNEHCGKYLVLFPDNLSVAELALRTTRFLLSKDTEGNVCIKTTMMTSGLRPLRLDLITKRGDWIDSDSIEVAQFILGLFDLTISDIVKDQTSPYMMDLAIDCVSQGDSKSCPEYKDSTKVAI